MFYWKYLAVSWLATSATRIGNQRPLWSFRSFKRLVREKIEHLFRNYGGRNDSLETIFSQWATWSSLGSTLRPITATRMWQRKIRVRPFFLVPRLHFYEDFHLKVSSKLRSIIQLVLNLPLCRSQPQNWLNLITNHWHGQSIARPISISWFHPSSTQFSWYKIRSYGHSTVPLTRGSPIFQCFRSNSCSIACWNESNTDMCPVENTSLVLKSIERFLAYYGSLV